VWWIAVNRKLEAVQEKVRRKQAGLQQKQQYEDGRRAEEGRGAVGNEVRQQQVGKQKVAKMKYVEVLGGGIALFPGPRRGGEKGLVSTVCACA